LIALDARTGKPLTAFGDNGRVNLRAGPRSSRDPLFVDRRDL
jgi:glucose dehydrogenase